MSRGVLALAAALVAAAVALGGMPTPLDNEEIVRMVADGTPEADILEAIRARPPAFDVADDMLEELQLAGVPAGILAAMKARAAQAAPAPTPSERPRAGTTRLVVELSKVGAQALRAPSYADEDVKQRLRLPKEIAGRTVHDLAVFLACTTAEHVPDLWRQKSPLGRDANLDVRHEMLAFIPGDTPAGKKPRLTLPDRIEADVDDTEPHDLVLGIAARIGDRWMQVSVGVLPDAKVGPHATPLSARISAAPEPLVFKIALTSPSK